MLDKKNPSGRIRNAYETLKYRAAKEARDCFADKITATNQKIEEARRAYIQVKPYSGGRFVDDMVLLREENNIYSKIFRTANTIVNNSTSAQAYWDRLYSGQIKFPSNVLPARAVIEKFHPSGKSTFDSRLVSERLLPEYLSVLEQVQANRNVRSLEEAKVALAYGDAKFLAEKRIGENGAETESIGELALSAIKFERMKNLGVDATCSSAAFCL